MVPNRATHHIYLSIRPYEDKLKVKTNLNANFVSSHFNNGKRKNSDLMQYIDNTWKNLTQRNESKLCSEQ